MDDAIAVHLSDRSAAAKQREQTSAVAKQRDETSRPGDSFLPPVTIENRFLTDPIGQKESAADTNRPEDKEPEMIINPWFHPPIE
jgi:hypothetical protein